MNETLKANLLDRPPQMVLIDVGGEEEGDTGRYQVSHVCFKLLHYDNEKLMSAFKISFSCNQVRFFCLC